ncbi:hypothetical protein SAMN04490220_0005 [Rhodococcus jostii]|uniref:Uncharacterized protein n=1 Tax=Rhodococcus jostii TaxID=132919 RepID=A0A1H4IEM1_RHOJO|nr:hypothetical protein SAMN04490220_0005 [Rhodococcus jostii]
MQSSEERHADRFLLTLGETGTGGGDPGRKIHQVRAQCGSGIGVRCDHLDMACFRWCPAPPAPRREHHDVRIARGKVGGVGGAHPTVDVASAVDAVRGTRPGSAQLAVTASTRSTPESRSNAANSPVSASAATTIIGRSGHSGRGNVAAAVPASVRPVEPARTAPGQQFGRRYTVEHLRCRGGHGRGADHQIGGLCHIETSFDQACDGTDLPRISGSPTTENQSNVVNHLPTISARVDTDTPVHRNTQTVPSVMQWIISRRLDHAGELSVALQPKSDDRGHRAQMRIRRPTHSLRPSVPRRIRNDFPRIADAAGERAAVRPMLRGGESRCGA